MNPVAIYVSLSFSIILSFSKTGKKSVCSQIVILQIGREYCQFDLSYRTSPQSTDGVAVAGASGGPISIPSLGRLKLMVKVKREKSD